MLMTSLWFLNSMEFSKNVRKHGNHFVRFNEEDKSQGWLKTVLTKDFSCIVKLCQESDEIRILVVRTFITWWFFVLKNNFYQPCNP